MELTWRADTGPISLMRRAGATLWLARKCDKSVRKLQRELDEDSDFDEDEQQERWNELHRANAQAALKHILHYKGFLAKVGQGLSGSGGDVPAPWREEMSVLQDRLPVSTFDEVQRTLRAELGAPCDRLFEAFEPKPLASATVGQAHVAYLKGGSQKVCVKVQHKGVERLMNVDLTCVEFIAKRAIKKHKDMADFTPIIREWKRASKTEVDFTVEARIAARAGQALLASGVDVGCPKPLPELSSKRVLTMEFIEGWKISEVERFPEGTNLVGIVDAIVEAFGQLMLKEGLVHGDPHPGNVFVEPLDGGNRVRPVFLDWGIAKELGPAERQLVARWIIAALSFDRHMFMEAGRALGYGLTDKFEAEDLDAWIVGSIFMFRDSLPRDAETYLQEMMGSNDKEKRDQRKRMEEESKADASENGKKGAKPGCCRCFSKRPKKKKHEEKSVERIPGVLLFVLRAINLLQGLAGGLGVSVPFAKPLLRHAMAAVSKMPAQVTAPASTTPLELALLAKIDELKSRHGILGVQVAVLRDGANDAAGDWMCNLAHGVARVTEGLLRDDSLMPLLDVGVGVLVTLLVAALQRPGKSGEGRGVDALARQLWPEFGQKGKADVTISQLLQHSVQLWRPFAKKGASVRRFCNEQRMEKDISAAPLQEDSSDFACPVLGSAAAALLRRATGSRSAAAAVESMLQPLGLEHEIAYSDNPERMAWVGRRPITSLSLARVFAFLETKQRAELMKQGQAKQAEWLDWDELDGECAACTDPLLPNRPDLRAGDACATGRGLRGTAKGLCNLMSAGLVPSEIVERSEQARRQVKVRSLEEWERRGRCLDVGLGWQLFKFRRIASEGSGDAEEIVWGYGHADGATGSVALRLPNASIAVLLNSVRALDEDPHHVGFELLCIVAAQLGLEPVWHAAAPDVPKRWSPHEPEQKATEMESLQGTLARMEERLVAVTAQLEQLHLGRPDVASDDDSAAEADLLPWEFYGTWQSAEIEGIETVLSALKVPSAFHMIARQAQKYLQIKEASEGSSSFLMSSSTVVASRTMEDPALTVELGKPFHSKQVLGGNCRGVANVRHEPGAPDTDHARSTRLVIEKRFSVSGREVELVETYEHGLDGCLVLTIVCGGLAETQGEPVRGRIRFQRQGAAPTPRARGRARKKRPPLGLVDEDAEGNPLTEDSAAGDPAGVVVLDDVSFSNPRVTAPGCVWSVPFCAPPQPGGWCSV